MSEPAHVLVVAHQTAATPGLLDAVRERAQRGPRHVPPRRAAHWRTGCTRSSTRRTPATTRPSACSMQALPKLSEAAGHAVTGSIGDAEPLMAIHDAINLGSYDEIIISTLPLGVSRWLKLDLVSKTRALGLPVTHVQATSKAEATAGVA